MACHNAALSRGKIENQDELEFALFCIENLAIKSGVPAQRVYHALTKDSSILKTYIIPGYDILHTQSKDYILDDITHVMKEAGVAL